MTLQLADSNVVDAPSRYRPVIDDADAALLDSLGDIAGKRALVLGPNLSIMCLLIRCGCREVTELRQAERNDVSADVVVVSCAGRPDEDAKTIAAARRALGTAGRILVRTTADSSGISAREIERVLARNGFGAIRLRWAGEHAILTGELPLFGPTRRVGDWT